MATIQEIAKLAGVSVATVSHVVNKTRYVSPETAKKVENVIDSLEELPEFIVKKRNKTQKSVDNNILIFVTNNCNEFQSEILMRLSERLMNYQNTNLITIHTNDIHTTLKNYSISNINNYLGKIILMDGELKTSFKYHSTIKMLPTIFISETGVETMNHSQNGMNIIMSDCYNGSYNIVKHMIKNGHTKIAIIDTYSLTRQQISQNTDVLLGYKNALIEHNINIDKSYISGSLIGEKDIIKYLTFLLFEIERPTALFVANESALLSTLRFLKNNNINCPKDISIITFNHHDWYDFFSPPISCVKQDTEFIVEKALEILNSKSLAVNKGLEVKEPIIVPTIVNIKPSVCGIGRGPFGEKAEDVEKIYLSEQEKEILSKNKYTAVISFHYTGAAWMKLHEQGIKNIFNELGISLLAVTDAYFDPEMQNKQLESLMALDPDIVIAIPSENAKTSKAFKKIAKSKSKLVLITNVPNGLTQNDYVSCVSVNEWSHGRLAGSGLGSSMRNYKKRNIGMIFYDSDFYATNQRDAAAKQILVEEYPDLTIVGETSFKKEEEIFDKTIELIKNHPEIEGLYISWEGPATRVLDALYSIDRNDIIIGTADLDYTLAVNMAKNGSVKVVSAQLPFEQGQALALAAANALLEKSVPKFIGVEPIKVNRENLLESWKKIFKENPPQEILDAIKINLNP